MLKIAHIADVHWRGLSRHDEYREVFQAFIADVRAKEIDHIFIGGDIFHTKTTGISPEYIEQLTWWLNSLSEVATVHMILGNHDGNLVNETRQDAVTPIVSAMDNPRVRLYKNSGVYDVAPGYKLCVFSLFDTEGWKNVAPHQGSINIACYHGPVRGCVTETNWSVDDGMLVEFFDDYDFVFLGDIHKMQFLRFKEVTKRMQPDHLIRHPGAEVVRQHDDGTVEATVSMPNMGYPGSTLQQNYAEDVVHGYLHWQIDDSKKFDVSFVKLPNPRPYVTVDWMGDVEKTYEAAAQHPRQSRFRIRSTAHIPQQDTRKLSADLKRDLAATEVTFKIDLAANRTAMSAVPAQILKDDLRNPDVLLRLVKACHAGTNVSDQEWQNVLGHIKTYLSAVSTADGATVRNAKWSLKNLAFDNTFSYGQGNVINFDSLAGVVGVFGSNRVGKSSIVGTLMYALFNSTDRGPVKNLHVCNIREPFCYAKATVNVNGTDYVIERQTAKHENKKGEKGAITSLNLFKIEETGAVDMGGEQRTDTEKVIKSLLGNPDDFMLTSLSVQGDANQFIGHGSAKRRQFLSRFLDLDIFDRMHDLAGRDVNGLKSQLKLLPDKDWKLSLDVNLSKLSDLEAAVAEKESLLQTLQHTLSQLQMQLSRHVDFIPVTNQQVEQHRSKLALAQSACSALSTTIQRLDDEHKKLLAKQKNIESVLGEHDPVALKKKRGVLREMETTALSLQHDLDKESTVLTQHQKSLKILEEVPCGDSYPTCKFIKDAHSARGSYPSQKAIVEETVMKVRQINESLASLREEKIDDKLDKLSQLSDMLGKTKLDASTKGVELLKAQSTLEAQQATLKQLEDRLIDLEMALKKDENVEVVAIRTKIENCQATIRSLDAQRLDLATQKGKVSSDIEKEKTEKTTRENLLRDMKLHEIVSHAFSRKGIPHTIVSSQLPIINVEINKILAGIVDFAIELESDDDSDTLDVYINYGDSRRLIELCSGMEKMIASIAIRVALTNVSTLPKTDMFVIDEGFGVFDEAGLEACNKLLVSLKRYFKTIIVITHVDSVKDVADVLLEITKVEKNSRVVYN